MAKNRSKVKIVNTSTNQTVTCQFNPTEYSLKKQNKWKEKDVKGRGTSEMEFTGGKPAMLKVKLFFDSTATGKDVRDETNKLLDMAKPKGEPGEPPPCLFIWGSLTFRAVIKTLNQKFTMFLADGQPIRAKVDVTFQEVASSQGPQNPTSYSNPKKTRTIYPGDRLDLIAFQEYGDANRWVELAEANELENPMELYSGQVLKIPLV